MEYADMQSSRLAVSLMGDHLDVGESLRAVCPLCNGGTTNEQSFSITREPTRYLYHCFRAKCDLEGIYTLHGASQKPARTGKPIVKRNPFMGKFENPPEHIIELLFTKYGIVPTTLFWEKWAYCEAQDALVMPWYDVRGNQRGHGVKLLGDVPKGKPKFKLYVSKPEGTNLHMPRQFDPTASRDNPIIVVEDFISASRLIQAGLNSVALGGVSLPDAAALELKNFTDYLCIALDPDTWEKETALRMRKRYASMFKTIDVINLEFDPKDYADDEELRDAIFYAASAKDDIPKRGG